MSAVYWSTVKMSERRRNQTGSHPPIGIGMFEIEYKGGADPDGWVLKNVYNPNKATTLENGGSVFTIRSATLSVVL